MLMLVWCVRSWTACIIFFMTWVETTVVSLARPVQTISEKSENIRQPRGYIGNFDPLITHQSKHLCYYKKMLTFQQRDTRFGKKRSRKKRKHLSLLIYKSLTFIMMSGSGRFPSDIYIQPPKEFCQGVKHWIKFIKKKPIATAKWNLMTI